MTRTERLRRGLVMAIVGGHLWLAPFTFANPPDADWLDGVFDGGDYDDIALAVMAMTAVVPTSPVPAETIRPVLALELCGELVSCWSDPPPNARQIRAPPPA